MTCAGLFDVYPLQDLSQKCTDFQWSLLTIIQILSRRMESKVLIFESKIDAMSKFSASVKGVKSRQSNRTASYENWKCECISQHLVHSWPDPYPPYSWFPGPNRPQAPNSKFRPRVTFFPLLSDKLLKILTVPFNGIDRYQGFFSSK